MIFHNQALKGQHALITGATGGIGYYTAKLVAEMGAQVTVTGRREAILKQLVNEITGKNNQAQVSYVVADLAEKSERTKLITQAERHFGPITLLVNSAGITGGGKLEDLTQADLEGIMHVNYTVPILLTQEIYPSLKKADRPAVVNVSSLSGLRGTYAGTVYTGSKFALNAFTQSFALEAIEHGVRVNAVAPGYVDTKMGLQSIEAKGKREGRKFQDQLDYESKKLPSGRITQPQEVASTIAYLLTEAAQNIVGEVVKISGGGVL